MAEPQSMDQVFWNVPGASFFEIRGGGRRGFGTWPGLVGAVRDIDPDVPHRRGFSIAPIIKLSKCRLNQGHARER